MHSCARTGSPRPPADAEVARDPPGQALCRRRRASPGRVEAGSSDLTGCKFSPEADVAHLVEKHRGFAHQRLHLPHGFTQTDEDRAADDGVADMQLAHTGKRRDRLNVEVVERVSGVETHAKRAYGCAGVADLVDLGDHRGTLGISSLRVKRMRIRAGMDLTDLGA